MRKHVETPFRKFWHYLPFGCFMAALLCLFFAYGVAVGRWHVFPYRLLYMGWDSLNKLRHNPKHFIHPARYEGEGVVVYERDKVCPGVTLITGVWKDGNDWDHGIRLVDLEGKILQEWNCNPRDIWSRSPYKDGAGSVPYIHGALLLPDREVIFSLEYFGLVRLNSKSEVIWKLPYRTHHSIFQDDDGKLWICGSKWYQNAVPEFPYLKPPFVDDIILKVSLDGVIEREMSMLEILYRSGYYGLLFVNLTKEDSFYNTGDILHLNDIEVLSKDKADAFDLFHAGDIMVSMRHLNTVSVIDGETERIKWSLTYPFFTQHDPDFTEDGYITVFDNGLDIFGGSRILRIEPSTKEVTVLYGHKREQHFFTFSCGKHQHLPNRNILVTEAQAGRVFEITEEGEMVWSWIAPRWDKKSVPEILEGNRYGEEFASFVSGLRKDKK